MRGADCILISTFSKAQDVKRFFPCHRRAARRGGGFRTPFGMRTIKPGFQQRHRINI